MDDEKKKTVMGEERRLEEEKLLQVKELDNIKIQQAERARAIEEASFKTQADNIIQHVASESAKERPLTSIVKSSLADLKTQLNYCRKVQNELMMIIDAGRVATEIKWFGKIQKIYTDIQQKTAKFLQQHNDEVPKATGEEKTNSGYRLDRMKMPSFNGNIRDYPRFKSDFVKQVQPQTKGDDNLRSKILFI